MIDAAAANRSRPRGTRSTRPRKISPSARSFAPADGTVEEVYFRPGEVVNAGQAVIALLPPRNLKVRFFVAEPVRAALQIDQTVKRQLRRLPARPQGQDQLHRARGRVHPAGDLLARAAAEARIPGRGAARGRGDGALTAGQPVTVTLGAAGSNWCGDER